MRNRLYRSLKRIKSRLLFKRRNLALDKELLEKRAYLSQKHLDGCQVYADRSTMISKFPKKGVVAEVGVAKGDFSACILDKADPKKLILIDHWAMVVNPNYGEAGYQKVLNRFSKEISSRKVEILRGFSSEKLSELSDRSLDWVYIDASHAYEQVTKDLEVARLKVKVNGIIAGHDYFRWGSRGMRYGVFEAANRFCCNWNYQFVGLSVDWNNNWSYAIRVKS